MSSTHASPSQTGRKVTLSVACSLDNFIARADELIDCKVLSTGCVYVRYRVKR